MYLKRYFLKLSYLFCKVQELFQLTNKNTYCTLAWQPNVKRYKMHEIVYQQIAFNKEKSLGNNQVDCINYLMPWLKLKGKPCQGKDCTKYTESFEACEVSLSIVYLFAILYRYLYISKIKQRQQYTVSEESKVCSIIGDF